MGGVFAEPPALTLYSSNIQLSGIPDKLIVFVRQTGSALTCSQAESYATITNISINFNNQAGLLSSMTQQQLYRNSVQSGLTNLTWDQFCGTAMSVYSNVAAGGVPVGTRTGYSGACASLFG